MEEGPPEKLATFRPGDAAWPQLLAALGIASDAGGDAGGNGGSAAGDGMLTEHWTDELVAGMRAFIAAVDWTEPWIIALLSFHALTTVVLIATRRHHTFQVSFFMALIALALCGDLLNQLGHAHWRSFATVDYFDQGGYFVTMLFGIPIVLNTVLALVLMLKRAVDMMVVVKRRQLRDQIKQKQQATAASKKTN